MGNNLSTDEYFCSFFMASCTDGLFAKRIVNEMVIIYEELDKDGFRFFAHEEEMCDDDFTWYVSTWCRYLILYRNMWICKCYIDILSKPENFIKLTEEEKSEIAKGKFSKKKIFEKTYLVSTLKNSLKEITTRICGEGAVKIEPCEKISHVRKQNQGVLKVAQKFPQKVKNCKFHDKQWEQLLLASGFYKLKKTA